MSSGPEGSAGPGGPTRQTAAVIGAILGAAVGVTAGAMAYGALLPVLERSEGLIQELQGFAWNLVLVSPVVVGALGWWLGGRWHDRRHPDGVDDGPGGDDR